MNLELEREIANILQSSDYPTAPLCPYCDYKITTGRKVGLATHVIKYHPLEIRKHSKVYRLADLFEKFKTTNDKATGERNEN